VKGQLQSETFPGSEPGEPPRLWTDLLGEEKAKLLKDRLKRYCQKVRGSCPAASDTGSTWCGAVWN
jgi:hypothetical protein